VRHKQQSFCCRWEKTQRTLGSLARRRNATSIGWTRMTHIDWGYGTHGNHGMISFFPSDYRRLVSVFTATMSVNVHGYHGTHTHLFLRISIPSIRFGYPRPRCFLSILPNWFICEIYPDMSHERRPIPLRSSI
jgi:hypothetical protein